LSARDVMAAHLARIARLNPTLNAIVAKLDDERCLARADEADRAIARSEPVGPLYGLPIAFKDLEPAVGFPQTSGSTIFRDFHPAEDSVIVERLKRAGAIPIGKTNVPEFGMGSHTYNKVYGTTVNPYDSTKTAGGSSGGAGAALAAGLLPIADGSDYGGSLRNPANFNNIVALRPTVGLVPSAPAFLPFLGFLVKGPMARSVDDVALLLGVIAGADPRDPACYPSDPAAFDRGAGPFGPARIAWCPDLGGLPLDRRVRAILESRRTVFEALGCRVEEAAPPLGGIDDVFLTIRRWRSWTTLGPLLASHGAEMKREAVEEIEAGARITAAELGRAMLRHGEILDRMRAFEERYAFTICAVNQLPPFDATIDWPRAVDGVAMDHYIAWMKSAYWISATFRPAISVPAGFTDDGLPVGIQIVGRYRDDVVVLHIAHAFEQATRVGERRPVR
ncbi:MAG TPA: amidase family protein, partial [Vicinamibacterales bacterium]|nr:amidase family protein [Vicinamibacterales bacterium]